MPLAPGYSRKVISKNITLLTAERKYPRKQVIAIALSKARESKKKRRKTS